MLPTCEKYPKLRTNVIKKMRQFTGTMFFSNLKAYSLISNIETHRFILAGSILLVQKSWILMQKFTYLSQK
jgi:hypothetical protein